MDFLKDLRRLEIEFSEFQESLDSLFSPGMDKYSGYSDFSENLVDLVVETGPKDIDFEIQEEEKMIFSFDPDEDEDFRKNSRKYRPFSLAYPGLEIQRVPASQLDMGFWEGVSLIQA